MAAGSKTLRHLLLGQLHRATVTHLDLEAPDGLALDRALLAAAGFVPFEKLELFNHDTGARLALAVSPTEESGVLRVNGPAARLVTPGDRVTLASWGLLREKAAAQHAPRVVSVDGDNQLAFGAPPPADEAAEKARKHDEKRRRKEEKKRKKPKAA